MKKDQFLTTTIPMKVLVVDYNRDLLAYVSKVLQSLSFKVKCLDQSGAALRLLSQENNQFDLLLIDSNMSDVDIFTFLRLTKHMGALSVVMSEQEDDAFIHEVFKRGAFLVVKKPITIDAVTHIRQDVIRNRMHKHEINSSAKGTVRCEPKKRAHQSSSSSSTDDDDINVRGGSLKKKISIVWTAEICEKFDNAVKQLGEGRCFPKKILQLMGVPGLTRMQVASHLQKRRKDKLKFMENNTTQNHGVPSNPSFPVFGSLPSLKTNQHDQEESNTLIGNNLPINGWQTEVTHTGSTMMNLSNQNNIAQQTEYTQFPFGSEQAISGLRFAGQGSHDQNLSSIPRLSSGLRFAEEFPVFLKDLDCNGPNNI